MRILAVLTVSTLLFSLSGCQHLHLIKKNSDQAAAQVATAEQTDAATSHAPHVLRKLWAEQFGQTSIQDYPAACLAQSKLNQPIVVGQVIDTPRYAMITLAKQQQQTQLMGGELCIVNKISHHVEITAVDDLRFVTPASHPRTGISTP